MSVITTATAVANAMANAYRLRPAKDQFVRSTHTVRLFKVRGQQMKGQEFHYKVHTQPMTAARMVGNPVAAEEAEWPADRGLDDVDVKVLWTDLREMRGTVKYTGLAKRKTDNLETAIARTAQRLLGDVEDDMGSRLNAAMHQNADCVLAVVAATYNATTGGAYPGGSATTMFVKIDCGGLNGGGSISQFLPGQRLNIRAASDNATIRCSGYVNDVYVGTEGANGVAGIGPGFTMTREDDPTVTETDAHFDNVADGDEIVLSGEQDYNFQTFPTWFSRTAGVFDITRTALGSQWSVPWLYPATTDGSIADFDVATHIGNAAQIAGRGAKIGRRQRDLKGTEVGSAFVAIVHSDLAREAAMQASAWNNFTANFALTDKEGKSRELFGIIGFDGAVLHDPVLGAIGFEADEYATPNRIRVLDPSSWFWITGHEGSAQDVEWLEADGRRFRYEMGTARGNPKNILVGGWLTRVALANDCPKANIEISNIKGTLSSSIAA